MDDHGEMPIEDFTHGLYKNVIAIKVGIYLLILLELGKYLLW